MKRWISVVPLLGAVTCGVACVTEPVSPDGFHRPREVRSWTDDDPTPRTGVSFEDVQAAESPDAYDPYDPYGDREEVALFPPGLMPPVSPVAAPAPPPAASPSIQDRPALSPYHRFSHQTIRRPDGRLTRLYWVRFGTATTQLVPILQAHLGLTEKDIDIMPGMSKDPRPLTPFPKNTKYQDMPPGVADISDLIMITATEEVLLQADQLMSALLTETPQIEIEARVVEINFEDGLEIGVNLSAAERTPKTALNEEGNETIVGRGNDISTAFKKFTSPLDPAAFLSGGQVGSLVLSLFENDIKFRAILRAIQNSSNTDVLSAPKMAVLNGHRAIIDTGRRTPVFSPVIGSTGNITTLTVKYEDTGVKLIVTPYLLMDDMIQVDVLAEVSFVSGFVDSGATGVLNPVFSTRTASTVVNVRGGQTLGIGGLISTDEIELVTKLPILGDIPILGYLFKTKRVTKRQSQVIFFLTPRLVPRSTPIFDPGI